VKSQGKSSTWPWGGGARCIQGIEDNVCPTPYEHMLGSTIMQEAMQKELTDGSLKEYIESLKEDKYNVHFAVGSAGVANNATKNDKGKWIIGGTSNNNGRCYEVRLNPDNTKDTKNILLMQSINTSLPNAFDIYQSAGGAGAFPDNGNGMNSFMWNIDYYPGPDGKPTKHGGRTVNIQDSWLCKGMHDGMKDGKSWKQFAADNGKNVPKDVKEACELYFEGAKKNRFADSDAAYKSLIDSCVTGVGSYISCPKDSNNHKGSKWRAIECPTYLTKVSGLRLKNPAPDKPHVNTPKDLVNNLKDSCDNSDNSPGCLYKTTDFGPNVVGAPTGMFNSSLEVTQMQDGRSPDAAQCFEMPKNTEFESGYESVWNYNTNGELIKSATNNGCFNLPFVNNNPLSTTEKFANVDFRNKDEISSIPGNWTTNLGKTFDRWSCEQPYLPITCPPVFPEGCDTCILQENKSTCDNMVTSSDSIKSCLVTDNEKHCDICKDNKCYYNEVNSSTKKITPMLLQNTKEEAEKWGVKEGPIPCVNMKLDYCWDDNAKNLSSSYENKPECWDKQLYQQAFENSPNITPKDKEILASMNETSCAGVKQICEYNNCAWLNGSKWNPNISTIEDYCGVCNQRSSAHYRTNYIDLTSTAKNLDKNFATLKNRYESNLEPKAALCPSDIMKKSIKKCPGQTTNYLQSDSDSCAKMFDQCGGKDWKGPTCCQTGSTCKKFNEYYSHCVPNSGPSPPGPGTKCSTTLPDSCGARLVNKPKTPSGSVEESCFYSNGIIKPECANKCTVSAYNDPQTYNPSKCFRKPPVPQ